MQNSAHYLMHACVRSIVCDVYKKMNTFVDKNICLMDKNPHETWLRENSNIRFAQVGVVTKERRER